MRHALRRFRNRVRLLVFDHLQPMLEAAQEIVGFAELVCDLSLDVASGRQGLERLDRAASTERRIAAAQNKLLRLYEELDLADAAAAELDVVSGRGDRAVFTVSMDLPLDGVDVLDGCVVEIAAPDERLDRFEKPRRR